LRQLAELAHLEATYFSRQFSRRFGLSPVQYIQRQRIERAQRLLWETDATLSVIAEQTGFSSPFHLSKTFKKLTGMPPSEFRRRRAADRP